MRNFGDVEVVPWIPGKSLGVALGDRGKVCASPRTSPPRSFRPRDKLPLMIAAERQNRGCLCGYTRSTEKVNLG